ncbi:hypothetical protein RDI58_025111 [Solanum bulbocastanum]|uniref:Uncharacterized protein n=1 Tax=Solanum bulbocastanum TaxID=147425 RepID=A0AAN8Y6A0_SOLBU
MNVFPNSRNIETTRATPPIENPIELLVNEAFGGLRHEGVDVGPSPVVEEEETLHDMPALNKKNLFELLKDGSQELYEGSKCLSNDCMLYWKDDVNAETCKYCHTSRWKPKKKSNTDHSPTTSLASDGFNPFGTMSTSHSIWLVILVPYNLPPWLCMKQPNFILSMIIPGLRAPENNIDIYVQPLIKELKELWSDGVDTFDSLKNEMFRMRAAFMWKVSDFSGLDSLSGWNTHTGLSCPSCNFDAEPCRLPHSRKWCFIGHRRFLSRNHKFRIMRYRFDGTMEVRTPPKKLAGSYIFQQVKDINVIFRRPAELNRKRKRNKQRNDDEEKSKDHIKARKNLQDMSIWSDLWPDKNGECRLSAFTISKKKKLALLKTLKNILVPDGYTIILNCRSNRFKKQCQKAQSKKNRCA